MTVYEKLEHEINMNTNLDGLPIDSDQEILLDEKITMGDLIQLLADKKKLDRLITCVKFLKTV
jgi:hypothetical protein